MSDSNALEELLSECIIVQQTLDEDGNLSQAVSFSEGISMITALGMLEYAKVQLLSTGRPDGDTD